MLLRRKLYTLFGRKFYNLKYGKCYLLGKKNGYYFVWADKCFNHYIVCDYMDSMGTMMNQEFFKSFFKAYKFYRNKVKKAKTNYSKICISTNDIGR